MRSIELPALLTKNLLHSFELILPSHVYIRIRESILCHSTEV